MTAGDTLRDQALEAVEQAADQAWKRAARLRVITLIGHGQTFSTDEVWFGLDHVSTREPRAMGAVIRAFAKAGLIELVRYEKSARPACHARPVAVWRPVR